MYALSLRKSTAHQNAFSLPKVRWVGIDGSVRTGVVVALFDGGTVHALDLLRMQVSRLSADQYEPNAPKDDEGNAR